MIELLVVWFVLSVIAGVIAENKGRSGVGFFFLSLMLSPLIGILAAVAAKADSAVLEQKQLVSGRYKRCPQCAEIIRGEARRCRFCGSNVDT